MYILLEAKQVREKLGINSIRSRVFLLCHFPNFIPVEEFKYDFKSIVIILYILQKYVTMVNKKKRFGYLEFINLKDSPFILKKKYYKESTKNMFLYMGIYFALTLFFI